LKLVKLAAGVLNQTPLDWDANQRNIVSAIELARRQRVSILCLPELCITGYGCEDAFHSAGVCQTAWQVLQEILPCTSGIIVSLGLPILNRGGLYNCAALVSDGALLGLVGKQNLAGEGLHYEPRWFKAWPADVRVDAKINGQTVPLGDLMFDCGGVQVGFEICEDAWVANRPGGELARQGVDILLNPSASHFAFGKHDVRQRFVLDGSRAFAVSYVYANLVGNEAGRAIYDGDAMIASCGQMLALGPRFSFATFQITTAVVDVDATRMNRARTASFRPDLNIKPDLLVSADFPYPAEPTADRPRELAAWELSKERKEEEFTRAITLALFDYLRKSRSRGFVVSLSGGADSAAVAVLCAKLVELARAELGPAQFAARLSYTAWFPGVEQAEQADEAAWIARLLTCAYQSTRNSSAVTLRAAQQVALAIGATFYALDVDALVQSYTDTVSAAIGRPLTWKRDDLALQNIQARVRGPGVWLLANLAGALLLATSNRSEAAVGYATMDGDTCGGLSPIAGIDKAFLRRWLHWMQHQGPQGNAPVPALALVNQQQPTAELRPPEEHQTDEQDLMPYDLLDAIERAAIRDKRTPLEVFQTMQGVFPQFSRDQLGLWVERFFRLWCRNQWKRERYAPSFHVDDENLDPKTWCRFPILSGGYERELRELREYLAGGG